MDYSTTFGQRLHALRKAKGITQADLAAQVATAMRAQGRSSGFTMTYLCKIEKGRLAPPSVSAILALAEALGASSDELLALARKAPSDLGQVLAGSAEARRFYRRAQELDLGDDQWRALQTCLEALA